MDMRRRVIGHMEKDLIEETGWTKVIQSEVADLWIHLIGGVVLIDYTLVMVPKDIITIITIILTGGVRRDIF